jgi:predicted  nucleic acid-binding Zn-ribbon protein
MNQIMVNAVEFDSLLKEVEYLKHENQKLKEQLKDAQDRIRSTQRRSWVCRARVYKTMSEEVTVNDIAALLEVSRKSAIQRMARLVKKNQAIKLNMPTVGNPARFKLLVSKESLLHTQKFAGPKMNRED